LELLNLAKLRLKPTSGEIFHLPETDHPFLNMNYHEPVSKVTSQKLMVKRLNLPADGAAALPEHIENLLSKRFSLFKVKEGDDFNHRNR